jgi:hypothetical protein
MTAAEARRLRREAIQHLRSVSGQRGSHLTAAPAQLGPYAFILGRFDEDPRSIDEELSAIPD